MSNQGDEKADAQLRDTKLEVITFAPEERAKILAKAEKHWNAWVDDKQKKNLPGQDIMNFGQAKIKELAPRTWRQDD